MGRWSDRGRPQAAVATSRLAGSQLPFERRGGRGQARRDQGEPGSSQEEGQRPAEKWDKLDQRAWCWKVLPASKFAMQECKLMFLLHGHRCKSATHFHSPSLRASRDHHQSSRPYSRKSPLEPVASRSQALRYRLSGERRPCCATASSNNHLIDTTMIRGTLPSVVSSLSRAAQTAPRYAPSAGRSSSQGPFRVSASCQLLLTTSSKLELQVGSTVRLIASSNERAVFTT